MVFWCVQLWLKLRKKIPKMFFGKALDGYDNEALPHLLCRFR
jgi:hypothetical protein